MQYLSETSLNYAKLFLIKAKMDSFPDLDLETNQLDDLTIQACIKTKIIIKIK